MKLWLFGLFLLGSSLYGQTSSTGFPSPTWSGIGSPSTDSIPCNASVAGTTASQEYIQRDLTGNNIWKCELLSDNATYSWQSPFIAPFQATGITAVITPPTLIGCTSANVTIPGANPSTMAALIGPVGSPGTGQINSTAYVSATNTVTVTLCLPLTLVYTANTVAYKVLVF